MSSSTWSSPVDLGVLGDLAVDQEHDPVRVRGDARIVGDDHDRATELVDRAAQKLEHLGGRGRVEVAGRLVGEDDCRLRDQGARDRDALLLAARELGGAVLSPVRDADGLEQLVEPF